MRKISRKYTYILMLITALSIVSVLGFTLASFTDKGSILGSSFSVGSSDLKLLQNLALGAEQTNLADQLTGPSFTNITPMWQEYYLIKLFNNGTTSIQVTTNANYLTANDPDDLRNLIFVELFDWNDANTNGSVDDGEIGSSYGKKSLVKWKTEGFNLGSLNQGEIKGLQLIFSAESISETKQGKTGIFDFEFDSISL